MDFSDTPFPDLAFTVHRRSSHMKILIAGAGYVGGALALRALAQGHEVLAWNGSAESAALLAEQEPRLRAEACDVSDPAAVRAARSRIGAVDAVALTVAPGRGGGADRYRAVYLTGARNIAAAFPEARLVYTGSTSVHAQTDGSWVNEDSPTEPNRETGRILLEAERVVREAGGTVLRAAGIYGPGRSVLLRRFLAGEAVLEAGGVRWINQIHRDDLVSALDLALALPAAEVAGRVFLAADDRPLRQRELYVWLAARTGRPMPPDAPADHDRKRGWTHKRVCNTRLRALGWRPEFPTFLDAVERGLLST